MPAVAPWPWPHASLWAPAKAPLLRQTAMPPPPKPPAKARPMPTMVERILQQNGLLPCRFFGLLRGLGAPDGGPVGGASATYWRRARLRTVLGRSCRGGAPSSHRGGDATSPSGSRSPAPAARAPAWCAHTEMGHGARECVACGSRRTVLFGMVRCSRSRDLPSQGILRALCTCM